MKLSNIFEQDPDQAAAMGANALKKTMGANTSGAMISKALGKLDQGGAISGPLAKALSPYADALEKILSNPMYRNKFMQMMKQIQTADNKAQAQPAPAVQEDWGSSDGYVLVKAIDDAVAARGLSPEVIQDEAENLAELYYDNMGYDSPEEAVDRIINTWKLRSSTGKALARMFATDESVQEDEQIDELEKKTLGSYVKKASGAERQKNVMDPKNVPLTNIAAYQGDSETGHFGKRFNQHTYDKAERLRKNRETGIKRAVDKITKEEVEQVDELSKATLKSYGNKASDQVRDYVTDKSTSFKASMNNMKREKGLQSLQKRKTNEEVEQVDEISKATMGRYINKAKDSIDNTSYRSGIKDGTAISSSTPYKSNNPLEKKLTKRHKGISMAVKKLTKEDIDTAKSMHESYKMKFDAALEHYNIKSPSELGEEKRKEFFNHVDQEFKKGDN